jgi:glycopeptide antibiotics resistance protein
VRQKFRSDWLLLLVLWAATLGSVALISAATLFPFDFDFRRVSLWEYFQSFRYFPSSFRDVPENLLLFFPAGYCIAALLSRSTAGLSHLLFRTGCAAFFVTLLVETLQLFLPSRVSNVSDLLANTCGAVLGANGFWILRSRRYCMEQFAQGFPVRIGVVIVVVTFLMGTLLLAFLNWGMHPREWDPSYKLACGNELTGDRPWRGSLADILIMDEAVEPFQASQIIAGNVPISLSNAVVAAYALKGPVPLSDSAGRSPALFPVSRPFLQGDDYTNLDSGSWLSSKTGMAEVSARVNRAKEFTIAFTVATTAVAQSGPGRIITISENTDRRNITVGQEGSDLVLRWRSPLQGANGSSAQARFHDVFEKFGSQRLVLTLNSAAARLYRPNKRVLCLPIKASLGLSAFIYEDQTHSTYAAADGITSAFGMYDILLGAFIALPTGFALGDLRAIERRQLFQLIVPVAIGMAVLQQVVVTYLARAPFSFSMSVIYFCFLSLGSVGAFFLRNVVQMKSSGSPQ